MAQQMKYCMKCGKPIGSGTKFCMNCGFRLDGIGNLSQSVIDTAATSVAGTAVNAVKGQASRMVSQIPGANALVKEIAASKEKGEESFDLGDLGAGQLIDQATGGALGAARNTLNQVKGRANEILSPIKTLFSGIKSFFGNLTDIFKNPKGAIPVILLGILWIILGFLRDSDSEIVKTLNWLTFAEGGMDRDAAGMIGGIFGKGVVALAITSLFNGGLRDIGAGCKNLFSGFGKKGADKTSLPQLIIGIVIGICAYFVFVGYENLSGVTTMAGISGILVSLRSLGSKDGFLYQFAQSLTAKVQNGVRTAQNGKAAGLLTGITGGFAIITAISALF